MCALAAVAILAGCGKKKEGPQPPGSASEATNAVARLKADEDEVLKVARALAPAQSALSSAEVLVENCRNYSIGYAHLHRCVSRAAEAARHARDATPKGKVATTACAQEVESRYRAYIEAVPRMMSARVAWLEDRKSELSPALQGHSLWEGGTKGTIDLDWPNEFGRVLFRGGVQVIGTSKGMVGGDVAPEYRAVGYKDFQGVRAWSTPPACLATMRFCKKRTSVGKCGEFQLREAVEPIEEPWPKLPEQVRSTAISMAETLCKQKRFAEAASHVLEGELSKEDAPSCARSADVMSVQWDENCRADMDSSKCKKMERDIEFLNGALLP